MCDLANFRSTGGVGVACNPIAGIVSPGPAPLKVPVNVWKYSTKRGLDQQINADLEYVRDVFGEPWLGVSLVVALHPVSGAPTTDIKHGSSCQTEDENDITKQIARIDQTEFAYNRITVVYVDGINQAVGDETGFTCPHHPDEGTIIIMSASGVGNSTLAHELGHALGQWTMPAREHPDVPLPRVAGLESSNLMWSSERAWGGSARRNLTLGQIAQMNFGEISFLKRARISNGDGLRCDPDPTREVPCPRLAKDFVK
jgi:hypothetical protein